MPSTKGKPVTEFQTKCLQAIARHANGQASAADISWSMGMKLKGTLAAASAMRSLLKRDRIPDSDADVSEWIVRLAPRDQWSSAVYCLRKKAWEHIGYEFQDGKGWVKPK